MSEQQPETFVRSAEYFRERIENCASRLVRLVRLNAPSAVIAREIWLIGRYGNAYCADQLAAAYADGVKRSMRQSHGYCWTCDNRPKPGDDLCPECDARFSEQYSLIDFDEPAEST